MDGPQRPTRIDATLHEKIWGRPRDGIRLGEIWFRAYPLLLKYIFTTEKLSVQVHPGDAYALEHENSAGKTECWYILDAEPGASLAVGLRRRLSRQEILAGIESQTIEGELNWLEMKAGDFVFVPWGTVHAIGPGLTLCEVQQFSDVTYRLFDYGRPRPLHIEQALDVVRHHPSAGRMEPARASAPEGVVHEYLVGCRYFVLERFKAARPFPGEAKPGRVEVLAFLSGEGEVEAGGQREPFRSEQMWRLPDSGGAYSVIPRGEASWLRAWLPAGAAEADGEMASHGIPGEVRRRVIVEDV